jgi:hypothetical protein
MAIALEHGKEGPMLFISEISGELVDDCGSVIELVSIRWDGISSNLL